MAFVRAVSRATTNCTLSDYDDETTILHSNRRKVKKLREGRNKRAQDPPGFYGGDDPIVRYIDRYSGNIYPVEVGDEYQEEQDKQRNLPMNSSSLSDDDDDEYGGNDRIQHYIPHNRRHHLLRCKRYNSIQQEERLRPSDVAAAMASTRVAPVLSSTRSYDESFSTVYGRQKNAATTGGTNPTTLVEDILTTIVPFQRSNSIF